MERGILIALELLARDGVVDQPLVFWDQHAITHAGILESMYEIGQRAGPPEQRKAWEGLDGTCHVRMGRHCDHLSFSVHNSTKRYAEAVHYAPLPSVLSCRQRLVSTSTLMSPGTGYLRHKQSHDVI